MEKLYQQLQSIEAIIDTVNPKQIQNNPEEVNKYYKQYTQTYNILNSVEELQSNLLKRLFQGKTVNGYLSADYGYGKTATLVYLWHQCQSQEFVAVPPFKLKELNDLIVATYGWLKWYLQAKPEVVQEIKQIYQDCTTQTQEQEALVLAKKHKISETKAFKIVQELKSDTAKVDNVLQFWQASTNCLQSAGFKGLIIFADEIQEFLRTEAVSSVRIQILSDLIKGMRALGSLPIALVLGMPTDPTESAIAEQAGDVIHRMQEQKVSLQLADAYTADFPKKLWKSLCSKFLDETYDSEKLVHPATLDSLAQLCNRKDLTNGPRTTIEVFKRLVNFAKEEQSPYTPLNLIDDYLNGRIQFYGSQQHRINGVLATLEQLPSFYQHPQGQEVMRLLVAFPDGVSKAIAAEFELLNSLQELVNDDELYGLHLIQPKPDRFALVALSQPNTPTVVDKILNRFRQRWFQDWSNSQKQEKAAEIFRTELLPSLFPPANPQQKSNWTWPSGKIWKSDKFGFYTILSGAPERYASQFPGRNLVISVGTDTEKLMRFVPEQPSHLDWRFYLDSSPELLESPQRLTSIAGTGQIDFQLNLARSFQKDYPLSFGLLRQVMAPEECSACTLLSLSHFIYEWLLDNPEVSQTDRERLEHHRQECHQQALRLLFPKVDSQTWSIEGLQGIRGGDTRFIESIFIRKCQALFPNYSSFAYNLRPTLVKYTAILEKMPPAVRRGYQTYRVSKAEFEKVFESKGSSLPSLLSLFKQHQLVAKYELGKKSNEFSWVQFSEHPLELFVRQQLSSNTSLRYETLWKKTSSMGYLREELDTALEWLQLRRYIEWNRGLQQISEAVNQIDSTELLAQVRELQYQTSNLLNVFNDRNLLELDQRLNQIIKDVEENPNDEITLDSLQRQIKREKEYFDTWQQNFRSHLLQKIQDIHEKINLLTRDLWLSRVTSLLETNSGLEPCLNQHRGTLENKVKQFEKEVQQQTQTGNQETQDLLVINQKLQQSQKAWEKLERTQTHLQELVHGLEEWRILARRIEGFQNWLINERRQRYNEFLDRVVTYFDTHGIEALTACQKLKLSWSELEVEICNDRQKRREEFDKQRSQYEAWLQKLNISDAKIEQICHFDEENENLSYQTLRQVFWQHLESWCQKQHEFWKKLERDLLFLEQEYKKEVKRALKRVRSFPEQLSTFMESIANNLDDFKTLDTKLNKLKELQVNGEKIEQEFCSQLYTETDTGISEELTKLLENLRDGASISELKNYTEQDVWEVVKHLYKKGYLEIALFRRNKG